MSLATLARRAGKTSSLFGISPEPSSLRGEVVRMPAGAQRNRTISQHWAWCRRNAWGYAGGYAMALGWMANGRRWS